MSDVAFQLVKSAVQDLAAELGYDNLRDVAASTELFGGADGIDSLTLVRLVAEIERSAEEKFRRNVVLADEQAMSRRRSPFRTVGTLAELLRERLGPGDG
jgi:acyl carrier protein